MTSADLVLKNAKVITMDPSQPSGELVATKGDNILLVAGNEELEKVKGATTKIIDCQGRTVLPGFNDAHCHFGSINPDYIDLRYITDPNIITERVAEKVKTVKPGELIRGGRWEHEMFTDKKWPTKELIDKVAPDNPVVLSRADGHSCLVNSYILKKISFY